MLKCSIPLSSSSSPQTFNAQGNQQFCLFLILGVPSPWPSHSTRHLNHHSYQVGCCDLTGLTSDTKPQFFDSCFCLVFSRLPCIYLITRFHVHAPRISPGRQIMMLIDNVMRFFSFFISPPVSPRARSPRHPHHASSTSITWAYPCGKRLTTRCAFLGQTATGKGLYQPSTAAHTVIPCKFRMFPPIPDTPTLSIVSNLQFICNAG
ncbi:hypothetical protein EDB92DRAFT_1500644 [Lactarius akahatsu]|uniref:Uncharacterized protein n=1 Tax=Lactarius akahatsu TaxID=416441 RepID=A0AAD4LAQ5_9AGAM|nr:hypothetical protein EDB92DRAFT_1500644 [Lactarius akahatsu]